MKREKLKLIVYISIVGILSVAGTFAFKYAQKEIDYKTLLTKADKNMEDHNFNDAKSLYQESLSIKNNKEILEKLNLIKNTQESLDKLNSIDPLVQENKFDEATEVLTKIQSPSEYVSNEIKTKSAKVTQLKEDFIEQEKKAKEAEEKRKAEEKRLAEEKRKAEEKKQAEEQKKANKKKQAEEQKKIEENKLINENKKTEPQIQQQVNSGQGSNIYYQDEPPVSSDHYKKSNLPSNEYNIRKVILWEVKLSIYITPDQALNLVAKDYFHRNPTVNVREPLFRVYLMDGSYYVEVVLNDTAVLYEMSPLNGGFKFKAKPIPYPTEEP